MSQRHERADQRNDENQQAEQTGPPTWRFQLFLLFCISIRFRDARGASQPQMQSGVETALHLKFLR
jgi:hypothetical protein